MYLYGGLAKPIAAGILILFCLYLALYHVLFATLIASFRRSRFGIQGALLLSPFAWVAVELARARVTSFPWDLLGIAQVDNSLLSRLAPITGAYGLSFVIAAVNALWLVRIRVRERRHTRTLLTLVGVAFVVLYVLFLRYVHPPTVDKPTATATLVQHNLGVGTEADSNHETNTQLLDSFSNLSRNPALKLLDGIPELAGTRFVPNRGLYVSRLTGPPYQYTNLVIWPESPAPFEGRDPIFRDAMSQLARQVNAPIIAGNLTIEPNPAVKRGYDLYNSASLIAADGEFIARYDKMHLVPFGEYVPFKPLFFFAGDLMGEVGTFDHGTHRVVFTTGGHRYGTFICYESVFADEVRQFVSQGAEVLVNISNDGWYGDTSAAWQHLNMVRMRAIENHRWILRATNTGVTASIDPYGRVIAAAPRHVRTAIAVPFGYEHDLTFYTRYGDLFAYLCALVTTLALVESLRSRTA
jgi:apolipoprotein N-acyltransferase